MNCFNEQSGFIDFNLNLDPAFDDPASTEIVDQSGNIQQNGNLPAGTYGLRLLDGNGCLVDEVSFDITQPTAIQASISTIPTDCNNTGQIQLETTGGTPPYQWSWSDLPGNTVLENRENLSAGVYRVTISDQNGCQQIFDNITVDSDCQVTCDPAEVVADNKIDPDCGQPNGSVDLIIRQNPQDYLFTWSGGIPDGPSQSGLAAGVYSITITAIGDPDCVSFYTVALADQGRPSPMVVQIVPTACGGNTGSAILAPDTYNYVWCNGQTGTNANNLPGGSCTVEVTDPLTGCTVDFNVFIPSDSDLDANVTINSLPTCGDSNGNATVNVFNGSGNFQYDWSDGGQGANRSDLSGGAYSITVTDQGQNNCSVVLQFVLPDNLPASANLSVNLSGDTLFLDCAGDRGMISFTISPDQGFVFPPDTTLLDALGNEVMNGDLVNGDYCLVITDGTGCVAGERCFVVKEPSQIFEYSIHRKRGL